MHSVTSNAVAEIVHWKLLGGFGNDETMTVPKNAKEVKIGAYDQVNRYVFNSVSELLANFENDTTRLLISWISGANYPSILYNGKDTNGNYVFTAKYCATGYTTIVYYK